MVKSQAVIVNDKVCFKKGYTSNDLKNLPRMNPRTFKMVEKNWGYYDMYTCEKDSNGQLIYSNDLGNFEGDFMERFDLTDNPAGTYYLMIQQNDLSITKKVIIVRA